MHICIVLDVSVSMMCVSGGTSTAGTTGQPHASGALTQLDMCKSAIDHLVNLRARMPSARNDRYECCTSDGRMFGWQAGATASAFMSWVKNVAPSTTSDVAGAIRSAFNMLNLQRPVWIDNLAQGRVPWYIDPAIVIILTDGGRQVAGITPTLTGRLSEIATTPPPSSAFYQEQFRWDHRVFAAVVSARAPLPTSIVELCSQTAGMAKSAPSMKALLQLMDTIAVRIAPTVLMRFTSGTDTNRSGIAPLLITHDKGNWPIPCAFLPDSALTELPATSSIPHIIYKPLLPLLDFNTISFPTDRYDLESGALPNQFSDNVPSQWSCHIANSLGNGVPDKAFAILSTGAGTPSLTVLPYNFSRVLRLLRDCSSGNTLTMQQLDAWRIQMGKVPFYYVPALHAAFSRSTLASQIGAMDLFADPAGVLSHDLKLQITKVTNAHNSAMQALQQAMETPVEKMAPLGILPRPIPRGSRPPVMIRRAGPGDHQVPLADMGNYQLALQNRPTLRDPFSDDENSHRIVNFGNRFKRRKSAAGANKFEFSVDEADEVSDEEFNGARQRETVVIRVVPRASLQSAPDRSYWPLAPLFWSFTSLLSLSKCDAQWTQLVNEIDSMLATHATNVDLPVCVRLCQVQAQRYANAPMAKWIADRTATS